MSLTCLGIGTKQIQISTIYVYILGRVYPRFISALAMVGVGVLQVVTWIEAIGSCPGIYRSNYVLEKQRHYPYMHTSSLWFLRQRVSDGLL